MKHLQRLGVGAMVALTLGGFLLFLAVYPAIVLGILVIFFMLWVYIYILAVSLR